MIARGCTIDLHVVASGSRLSHCGTKACIPAWKKSMWSVYSHEVTAFLTSTSVSNRLPARCFLRSPKRCKLAGPILTTGLETGYGATAWRLWTTLPVVWTFSMGYLFRETVEQDKTRKELYRQEKKKKNKIFVLVWRRWGGRGLKKHVSRGLQQTLMWRKLSSPGCRYLGTDVLCAELEPLVPQWEKCLNINADSWKSGVYHLLPMCRVFLEIGMKFSASRVFVKPLCI
jgi:hypothetical protein